MPVGRLLSTSISGAIDFSVGLLGQSGADAICRVIDISGDGPNNAGRTVTLARDEAVAKGITINGLPFMLKRPTGYGDIENLDAYSQDCVIGGPSAFIVPVREAHQFADAIRTKLVREIGGGARPEAAHPPGSRPRADELPHRRDATAAAMGTVAQWLQKLRRNEAVHDHLQGDGRAWSIGLSHGTAARVSPSLVRGGRRRRRPP
jgi:hypothetical protein